MENAIETQRLTLRPWTPGDASDLFRYASDARVSRLALWPVHTSVDMSRRVIEEFFMPNPECYAVVLKETGEAVGCIGLVPEGDEHFPLNDAEREVDYWIGYPHWGRGLIPEALSAYSDYCRDTLGLHSLLITTDARNAASQRVAQKCGFLQIATYTADSLPSKAYRLNL